jgi:hypothetical protein
MHCRKWNSLVEYQFLPLFNNDLILRSDTTFQSPVSKALEVRNMAVFAKGSRGSSYKGQW